MDSQLENKLYEQFPDLYRERTASLEGSRMPWGCQIEKGWYKILYDMSEQIQKIAVSGDNSPAIMEVGRDEYGQLMVGVRNITPPIADIVRSAKERSRLTCEFCSYAPAILRSRKGRLQGHVACGRCVSKNTTSRPQPKYKRKQAPRRAPDTIVVKR